MRFPPRATRLTRRRQTIDFTGHTIIVTGGNRGIGYELSRYATRSDPLGVTSEY